MYLIIIQRLILEALFDVFYFPVWWYTFGLRRAAKWNWWLLKRGNETLGPQLWLINLFVPMFGQHDFEGRLISFFMRGMQVFFRTLALLVWLVWCVFLFSLWIVLPAVVMYAFFTSFFVRVR